jgi:MFS-type transporter involved in bile tolerance (Atg22 family)
MSMVTSFGSLVFFGLKFNERKTSFLVKWLLAFPMFAASVAARGFTLAVFLKETLGNKSEIIGGIVLLIIYFTFNVVTFKICGQDMIRSVVFGLSSTLIPAGYNNDEYFYQKPHQPLWDNSKYNPAITVGS